MMTEDIRIGAGNEMHQVRIDYKTLDEDGHTRQRTWTGDVHAGDAARALRFSLGMLQDELERFTPAPLKVWQMEAHVTVASDVLRQKLDQAGDE